MKRFVVIFEDSAQQDVRGSYEWGCRAWGKRKAQQWARQLRTAVFKQLAVVPKGFPLAPEDDEFSEEIRQMVVGRYRVLFTIKRAGGSCATRKRSVCRANRSVRRGSLDSYEILPITEVSFREPPGCNPQFLIDSVQIACVARL